MQEETKNNLKAVVPIQNWNIPLSANSLAES